MVEALVEDMVDITTTTIIVGRLTRIQNKITIVYSSRLSIFLLRGAKVVFPTFMS